MWGDHLIRYKSNPPTGYVPPSRYPDRGTWRSPKSAPPGFIVGDVPGGRTGMRGPRVIGRNQEAQPRDLGPIDRCDDQYAFHAVAAQANERAAGGSLAIER